MWCNTGRTFARPVKSKTKINVYDTNSLKLITFIIIIYYYIRFILKYLLWILSTNCLGTTLWAVINKLCKGCLQGK